MAAKVKYIFRGTTLGFKGSNNCKQHSFTCSSTHPVIALLFAMECAHQYTEDAVVYIAKLEKVKHLKAAPNVLKKIEKEYVVGTTPDEFIKYTEGYIPYKEFKKIVEELGFDVSEVVRKEKLNELCRKIRPIKPKELESLLLGIRDVIKNS